MRRKKVWQTGGIVRLKGRKEGRREGALAEVELVELVKVVVFGNSGIPGWDQADLVLLSGISYREWVFMCRVIMSRRQAAYGHCGHLYGLSPVCVRWWVERWSLREKT